MQVSRYVESRACKKKTNGVEDNVYLKLICLKRQLLTSMFLLWKISDEKYKMKYSEKSRD